MTTNKPTGNNGCEALQGDLKAYSDGELSPVRRLMVGLHLSRCKDCRETILEMERIHSMLKQAGATEGTLSSPLRTKLIAGLQGVAPDTGKASPMPLWKQRPLLVFGGGGATVLASLMIFATLYGPSKQVMENQAATSAMPAAVPIALKMYAQEYDEALPQTEAKSLTPARANSSTADMADTAGVPGAGKVAARIGRFAESKRSQVGMIGDSANGAAGNANGEVGMLLAQGGNGIGPVGAGELSARDLAQYGDGPRRRGTAGIKANTAPTDELPSLVSERQVHREAAIGVAVDSVEKGDNKIVELVEGMGGYVADNDLNTDAGGYKYAELTVKVPVKEFDTLLATTAQLGELRSKSVTGKDITEQVSDATSDEQVLVNETQKLNDRLKSGGLTEKRMAATEYELRNTRLQLARARARLGLLRKMSALSTIQISLVEKAKKTAATKPESGFMRDLNETNRAAMTAFQAAVRVPIVLVIWVLAFSPIWVLLLLAYRYAAIKQAKQVPARVEES